MSVYDTVWSYDDEDLEEGELEAQGVRDALKRPVPCLWPKIRPRYVVRVWLRDVGDRFECAGFDVTQLDRGGPVGSSVMRSLPIGALISEAIERKLSGHIRELERMKATPPANMVAMAASQPDEAEVVPVDQEFTMKRSATLEGMIADAQERQRAVSGEGTGRRYPPGHLEEVARIVLVARRHGEPTSAAVAEAFGISKSAAANQISRARTQGLLDPDPQAEGSTSEREER